MEISDHFIIPPHGSGVDGAQRGGSLSGSLMHLNLMVAGLLAGNSQ